MFENIAAIDIGTSSIKVLTVKTGFRDFQLKTLAYEDIDFSTDDPHEAVINAINGAISQEELKGFRIITNLPMEKAIIRNISFPFSDVEKIAEAIPYEAEENIPFKIDDLVMDFQSLKNDNKDEGRILLAASHKETMHEFLNYFKDSGINPVRMGLEANGLYECYRYFNKIDDESIIQIDVGHNKTIVNIIKNNYLQYTRSISIGTAHLIHEISNILDIDFYRAKEIFSGLNIDLTSLENNLQRGFYKSLKITKPKFKKIYETSVDIIEDLIEQIIITVKASSVNEAHESFNRVLISGGGSNIPGLGNMISRELEIPVVPLPFLEEYTEQRIRTQFPIAFGLVLSYLNRKSGKINFLKGEFIPDIIGTSKKIYYLSATFAAFSLLVLIINLIITSVLTSKRNESYNKIINERFKKYFHVRKDVEDPIAEANKIIAKEKKELQNFDVIMSQDMSTLDILKNMLVHFPKDENFDLNNIVLNQRIIRIDGTIGESKNIDDFKEKLIDSKQFESVTLNIKYSRKNIVRFSMNIKLKSDEKKALKKGKPSK